MPNMSLNLSANGQGSTLSSPGSRYVWQHENPFHRRSRQLPEVHQ